MVQKEVQARQREAFLTKDGTYLGSSQTEQNLSESQQQKGQVSPPNAAATICEDLYKTKQNLRFVRQSNYSLRLW
jgi:hypothetical protein